MYKRVFIETLFHLSFRFCFHYESFHLKTEILNLIFERNDYLQNFVNFFTKNFLNRLFVERDLILTVTKMGVNLSFTILS